MRRWLLLAGLLIGLAVPRKAAADCATDIDCPGATCGSAVCQRGVGVQSCVAAGGQVAGFDGTCSIDSDCKCRGQGATCIGSTSSCSFTVPSSPADAGASASGAGTGMGGSATGPGGCSVGSPTNPGGDVLTSLACVGVVMLFARLGKSPRARLRSSSRREV